MQQLQQQQQKLNEMEGKTNQGGAMNKGGDSQKMIGFMEAKEMTPKVYEGKIEEWRDW